jgi:hypothetical protein
VIEMFRRVLAATLACMAGPCAALDLSLPEMALSQAVAPVPAYIILNRHPDTLPDVARYADAIRGQIHERATFTPLLDNQGRRLCAEMAIDLLLVLEKDGRLYDVQVVNQYSLDPQGARGIAREHLKQVAGSLAPFQPFPEPDLLGMRLVGIPIALHLRCPGGIRLPRPPAQRPFRPR